MTPEEFANLKKFLGLDTIEVKRSCRGVANLLKTMVNSNCKEGFVWFPEAIPGETNISLYDMLYAISVLEDAEDQSITITND